MTIGKLCFLLVTSLILVSGQSYNLKPEFKLIGPDELTAFLVDRLGGQVSWNLTNWDKRSDSEVKDIFAKHSLSQINPVPCLEVNCKKKYIQASEGTGNISSNLSDGNQTTDATSQINANSLFQLFLERDSKEEAHCLVASVNSTFANEGQDFKYTVSKSVSYGGGVRLRPLMDPKEENPENAPRQMEVDENGQVQLHIIRATSKSKLEESTDSENYSERLIKRNEVSATVVTFDTENCHNSVENVECDTLARVYHHIKSTSERKVTYKDKSKSYKTESYGTIITIVKKA
ncbi:uncharacterized protein LOC128397208 [Panonychus citri]|uniref:uncharacterized protein LOC128397208 n=1 Tax=Panonychus citri TaxID=50023 RepID=UPI0023079094|nr:uncharacterized protein LOC128397208 [Panonychus citri]